MQSVILDTNIVVKKILKFYRRVVFGKCGYNSNVV